MNLTTKQKYLVFGGVGVVVLIVASVVIGTFTFSENKTKTPVAQADKTQGSTQTVTSAVDKDKVESASTGAVETGQNKQNNPQPETNKQKNTQDPGTQNEPSQDQGNQNNPLKQKAATQVDNGQVEPSRAETVNTGTIQGETIKTGNTQSGTVGTGTVQNGSTNTGTIQGETINTDNTQGGSTNTGNTQGESTNTDNTQGGSTNTGNTQGQDIQIETFESENKQTNNIGNKSPITVTHNQSQPEYPTNSVKNSSNDNPPPTTGSDGTGNTATPPESVTSGSGGSDGNESQTQNPPQTATSTASTGTGDSTADNTSGSSVSSAGNSTAASTGDTTIDNTGNTDQHQQTSGSNEQSGTVNNNVSEHVNAIKKLEIDPALMDPNKPPVVTEFHTKLYGPDLSNVAKISNPFHLKDKHGLYIEFNNATVAKNEENALESFKTLAEYQKINGISIKDTTSGLIETKPAEIVKIKFGKLDLYYRYAFEDKDVRDAVVNIIKKGLYDELLQQYSITIGHSFQPFSLLFIGDDEEVSKLLGKINRHEKSSTSESAANDYATTASNKKGKKSRKLAKMLAETTLPDDSEITPNGSTEATIADTEEQNRAEPMKKKKTKTAEGSANAHSESSNNTGAAATTGPPETAATPKSTNAAATTGPPEATPSSNNTGATTNTNNTGTAATTEPPETAAIPESTSATAKTEPPETAATSPSTQDSNNNRSESTDSLAREEPTASTSEESVKNVKESDKSGTTNSSTSETAAGNKDNFITVTNGSEEICGFRNDRICGVFDFDLPGRETQKYRIFYAYPKDGPNNIEALKSKLTGTLTSKFEIKDIFGGGNDNYVESASKTYYVSKLKISSQKLDQIVTAIRIDGFKSFYDNLTSSDEALLNSKDFILVAPSDSSKNLNFKKEIDFTAQRDESLKPTLFEDPTQIGKDPAYCTAEKTDLYTKFNQNAALVVNPFKLKDTVGLFIEFNREGFAAKKENVLDRFESIEKYKEFNEKVLKASYTSVNVSGEKSEIKQTNYKGMHVLYRSDNYVKKIADIIDSIKEKGLGNEFKAQYSRLRLFQPFSILLIGNKDKLKELYEKIKPSEDLFWGTENAEE